MWPQEGCSRWTNLSEPSVPPSRPVSVPSGCRLPEAELAALASTAAETAAAGAAASGAVDCSAVGIRVVKAGMKRGYC